jgi:hypothetical protein
MREFTTFIVKMQQDAVGIRAPHIAQPKRGVSVRAPMAAIPC